MRKKRQRLAANAEAPNVLQAEALDTHRFPSQNVILELGCGYGEYTLALAERLKHTGNPYHFVGVDRNGARIWKGSQQALQDNIPRVMFIHAHVQALNIAPKSVIAIYLPFPDPYPKKRQRKHRLTARHFLSLYKKWLHPKGYIVFKTDNPRFYAFTLEELDAVHARKVEASSLLLPPDAEPCTRYEEAFLERGLAIYCLRFSFA